VWDPKATVRGEDKPLKDNTADNEIDALRYALYTTRSLYLHELDMPLLLND